MKDEGLWKISIGVESQECIVVLCITLLLDHPTSTVKQCVCKIGDSPPLELGSIKSTLSFNCIVDSLDVNGYEPAHIKSLQSLVHTQLCHKCKASQEYIISFWRPIHLNPIIIVSYKNLHCDSFKILSCIFQGHLCSLLALEIFDFTLCRDIHLYIYVMTKKKVLRVFAFKFNVKEGCQKKVQVVIRTKALGCFSLYHI